MSDWNALAEMNTPSRHFGGDTEKNAVKFGLNIEISNPGSATSIRRSSQNSLVSHESEGSQDVFYSPELNLGSPEMPTETTEQPHIGNKNINENNEKSNCAVDQHNMNKDEAADSDFHSSSDTDAVTDLLCEATDMVSGPSEMQGTTGHREAAVIKRVTTIETTNATSNNASKDVSKPALSAPVVMHAIISGVADPASIRDPRLRRRMVAMTPVFAAVPPVEEVIPPAVTGSQDDGDNIEIVSETRRDIYSEELTQLDRNNAQKEKTFIQYIEDGNMRICSFAEFVDSMPTDVLSEEDDSEDEGLEPPSPSGAINSLDISKDGMIVAASTLDHNIILWNLEAKSEFVMPVYKYGANHVSILPGGDQAITSSTKTNNDLRMLSWANPSALSYVRYFHGHTGQVCSLSVSSDGRNIISAAALDKKIFLWDILHEKPVGKIDLMPIPPSFRVYDSNIYGKGWHGSGPPPKPRVVGFPQPVVAFDPANVVFGMMCKSNDEILKLYDMRNYSNGPFLTVKHDFTGKLLSSYPKDSDDTTLKMSMITAIGSEFNDMKFSPDGQYILVNTNGPLFYVLDALTGNLVNVFGRKHREYDNSFSYPNYSPGISNMPEVSFSHDSQYVLGGNGDLNDPRIYVWSVETGEEVGIINKKTPRITGRYSNHPHFGMCYLKVNPVYMSIVVAGGRRITVYAPRFDDPMTSRKSKRRRLSSEDESLYFESSDPTTPYNL